MDSINILLIHRISFALLFSLLFSFSCTDDTSIGPDYIDENSNLKRGAWTLASSPVQRPLSARERMIWYNPYDPITLNQIWPDSSSNITNQTVLFIDYTSPNAVDLEPSSWCGIMRSLDEISDTVAYEYLNLWFSVDTAITNSDVIMYVDIGNISEDIDGDGYYDTEDRNLSGFFDANEDTGLDTLFSDSEYSDNPVYPDDPNGDDWDYSDSYTYTYINGTEGNREDPERRGIPDTEDINSNGALDLANSYFSYEIDLQDSTHITTVTETGWVNIRLPINDSELYGEIGIPSFEQINYIRIWLPVDENRVKISLAVLELE